MPHSVKKKRFSMNKNMKLTNYLFRFYAAVDTSLFSKFSAYRSENSEIREQALNRNDSLQLQCFGFGDFFVTYTGLLYFHFLLSYQL